MRATATTAASRTADPGSAPDRRRRHAHLGLAGLGVALATVSVLSVGTGPVRVPVAETVAILWAHLTPGEHLATWSATNEQIVWTFRLPRVLLAATVGAGLAVVGVLLQAVVRNPLADPYVLGASSGASLGAVLALVAGASVPGLLVSGSAFAGAALAGVVVYVLAARSGRVEPLRLVLAGVALSYLFSAGTGWITATAEHGTLPGLLVFLLGSISSATWSSLPVPLAAVVLGAAYAWRRADRLDAALTGEDTATSLGVDMTWLRIEVLVVSSALTGAVVAVAGGIGFVGMVAPHVCRLVLGAAHRWLVPASVLTGALLLVLVDTVARTVADPREIPLGVVTALVGAPFFLWLLRRRPVGTEQ